MTLPKKKLGKLFGHGQTPLTYGCFDLKGLKISKITRFWPNLGQLVWLIPGKPLE